MEWKWTLITEQRNWHTTANVSREKENEKGPLHGEALACFSNSTCLHLDKRSPGHVPCYLRASALIRNPSAFCTRTEQRKGGTEGECHHYSRESRNQNPPPPQILLPSPTAWQDITAELCWVGELRLCYWWLYRPQISITQTQSLSRDMATVAAIEGVRQFALCHQSNQPTHTHKQMCMHHFHSNLSCTAASMLLNKINTITKSSCIYAKQ